VALCDARLQEATTAAASAPVLEAVHVWGGDDPSWLEMAMARHTTPFTPCETASDDVVLIAFTSGTTGVPKGCMHFHRDVMAMCHGFSAQLLQLTSQDDASGHHRSRSRSAWATALLSMAARGSVVLLERATPELLLGPSRRPVPP
jgi:2-aminobenzoate-CoA ligase